MEIVPFRLKHACMFATCKADRACRVQRNLKRVPYFEEPRSVLPMVMSVYLVGETVVGGALATLLLIIL